MKKFLALLLFAASMFTTACGTDDEPIEGPSKPSTEQPGTSEEQPGEEQKPEQKPEDNTGKEPAEQEIDAMAFAQSLGIGWNLGNSFDAHYNGTANETCWGNGKATQATFNAVKEAGFSSVRIPVTWMGHIGSAPDYKIEAAWLNRVAEVVGYAHNAGLKVVINIHHDGAAGNENGKVSYPTGVWLRIADAVADAKVADTTKDKIAKVWQQIAAKFSNHNNWLIFETFNEIHDGYWGWPVTWALQDMLNQWNQVALDAIRSAGGKNQNRFVAIPCYAASPSFTKSPFTLPKDSAKDRLIVAVHTYDPYDFAGAANKSEWGHTGTVPGTDYKESGINNTLNTLKATFIDKGIPVYFGEFGCVHRSTERAEAFRRYYLEYNIKNMREHKMPVMIWDNGASGSGAEKFGLINHNTGAYVKNSAIDDAKEIVALMTNAWNSNDPNYTLQSIYNRAP